MCMIKFIGINRFSTYWISLFHFNFWYRYSTSIICLEYFVYNTIVLAKISHIKIFLKIVSWRKLVLNFVSDCVYHYACGYIIRIICTFVFLLYVLTGKSFLRCTSDEWMNGLYELLLSWLRHIHSSNTRRKPNKEIE